VAEEKTEEDSDVEGPGEDELPYKADVELDPELVRVPWEPDPEDPPIQPAVTTATTSTITITIVGALFILMIRHVSENSNIVL